MYQVSLIIMFVISSLQAISQAVISGNIVDYKTNLPVEGATITLLPSNISSVTNEGGRFSFKGKYDSTIT
ncbi:MAG: CarboxypepD reg-like domain, partial [Segetibacter sp.]|nr:CarboxypepD reg-like domain [Segetibacter sp.]